MSCSDHLTLALDDEESNTMQQLLRPLDHVPDSHGSAGRAQSADSLRCPLQTIPAREEEYGTEQLGRIGGFSLHGGGLPSLDFMAKLVALVPRPRTNLTGPPRYDFTVC